jgi:hypothetical protein
VVSYDETILPGRAGKMQVGVKTNKLRGHVGKAVTVFTNDPERPEITLTVTVDVLVSVFVIPDPTVRLSDRRPIMARSQLLLRRDPSETDPMNLKLLSNDGDWFTTELRQLTEVRPAQGRLPEGQPGDWLLELKLKEPSPAAQRAQGAVLIATGYERQPQLRIDVAGQFAPALTLSKKTIVFPAGVDAPSDTVLISVRKGMDPDALLVEASPPMLKARIDPASLGKRNMKLLVEWKGKRPIQEGLVTVRLGEQRYPIKVLSGPAQP